MAFIKNVMLKFPFNNFESNGNFFSIKIQFMNIDNIRAATIQLAWTSLEEHNWSTIRWIQSIQSNDVVLPLPV